MTKVQYKSYIDTLPSEIVNELFLRIKSDDLLRLLQCIENLPEFQRLFNSKIFWKQLWERDISSFQPITDGDNWTSYREVFLKLKSMDIFYYDKICHLTANGYDILLYPLLVNPIDYYTIVFTCITHNQIPIMKKLLTEKHINVHNTQIANSLHLAFNIYCVKKLK